MTYPSAPSTDRTSRSQPSSTAARSRHRSNPPSSRHRSSSVSSERSHRRSKHNPSSSTPSPSNARTSMQREGPSAKTTPMHDDTDAGRLIPVDRPALAIDYLGNGWCNEDDIAASWKFMTKQKNDLINGLRLENASWRNWAKQRHNLKTINPRTLNWYVCQVYCSSSDLFVGGNRASRKGLFCVTTQRGGWLFFFFFFLVAGFSPRLILFFSVSLVGSRTATPHGSTDHCTRPA